MFWILGLYPVLTLAFELLIRWMLGAEDTVTFVGPAISSAALGLLGPVAVARPRSWERPSSAGPAALLFCLLLWIFCLAVNIKKVVPPFFDVITASPSLLQILVAITAYTVAAVMAIKNESRRS